MVSKSALPRGIRNNNPGNIREAADGGVQWEGERFTDDDSAFEEFIEPEDGIRAMARVLITYYNKYGLNTVRGIITRWAPPHENNTEHYICIVSNSLNVNPDAALTYPADLSPLIAAIVHQENGQQPYSTAQIDEGIRRAYV